MTSNLVSCKINHIRHNRLTNKTSMCYLKLDLNFTYGILESGSSETESPKKSEGNHEDSDSSYERYQKQRRERDKERDRRYQEMRDREKRWVHDKEERAKEVKKLLAVSPINSL